MSGATQKMPIGLVFHGEILSLVMREPVVKPRIIWE